MNYSRSYLVKVRIRHEGCWTNRVVRNAIVKIINHNVYPPIIKAVLSVNTSERSEFFERLRRDKAIRRVNTIFRNQSNFILEILTKLPNTVSEILYNNMINIYYNLIEDEEEYWIFLSGKEEMRRILEELKTKGELVEKAHYAIDESMLANIFSHPIDSLTEQQFRILKLALKKGYFDMPRGTSTDEIARTLGISRASAIQHLRRAEKRIIEKFLNTFP